tara:strand:+ start:53 stop:496 length:444 start_codon:yes stop_codon:yes gene_type:complete
MWEILTTKLKSLLEDNTLLANTYTFEASELSGTPIATLTPSANDNDYATTTENTRVYAFMLRLYINRASGEDNEQVTEEAMRQLVDDVLDDLDKSHRLSGLGSKTGYQFLFLEAAPSLWGYAGRENIYRVAEINIRCHFAVDINLIA